MPTSPYSLGNEPTMVESYREEPIRHHSSVLFNASNTAQIGGKVGFKRGVEMFPDENASSFQYGDSQSNLSQFEFSTCQQDHSSFVNQRIGGGYAALQALRESSNERRDSLERAQQAAKQAPSRQPERRPLVITRLDQSQLAHIVEEQT